MNTDPFNPMAHDFLMRIGYSYRREYAEGEDVGTCETGPMLSGHDDFDMYVGNDDMVIISKDGKAYCDDDAPVEDFESFDCNKEV